MANPARIVQTALWILAPVLFHSIVPSAGARVVKLPIVDKQDIRFVPVSADGGALQSGIKSITQDKFGFLWLGGHGLYRYDGYGLKSYRHEPGEPGSLSDDTVMDVLGDRAGMLWIATAFGGVDRLDPAQGTVTHHRHEPGNERSLGSDNVACLYQDRRGRIWVGTNRGLDRLDPSTGSFLHFQHDPRDSASLSSNEVASVVEDRSGVLWVGTAAGLNRMDPVTGRFARFMPDSGDPYSVGRNYVTCIHEDHSGVLWVAIGNWLSSFDRNKQRIHELLLSFGGTRQAECRVCDRHTRRSGWRAVAEHGGQRTAETRP